MRLSSVPLRSSAAALALMLPLALPAAASTCADPDPALDLDRRIADCEADLASVWDRSGYPHLVFNLGRALRLQERAADALPVLQEALGYAPENPAYWAELARVYLALNEPATAVAMYSQAAALDPADPYLPADRAEAWFTLGKADACVADLDKALPKLVGLTDDAWFRNLHGRCLAALGRAAEALAAYDSALDVAPGYEDARGNRVYALQALGRYDEVLRAVADLLDPAKTPGLSASWDVSLRAIRIEALGFLNRGAEIDADIAALQASDPASLDIANMVAWGLFTAGRLDEADRAADLLRKAAEAGDALPGFMVDTLAQIDLAKGRTDQALEGFALAAWRDPGLAQGWVPALTAQGYLPQTRLADGILLVLRACVAARGAECRVAPLPVNPKAPIVISRPSAVAAPPAVAPAEPPVFEPGPAAPAADPGTPVPAEPPGLGTAPRPVRPAGVAAP